MFLTCSIECESLCPRFQTMHLAAKYSMNLHVCYLCMEFYRTVDVIRRENWEKTFFERSPSCPAQNLHLLQIFRILSHSTTSYFFESFSFNFQKNRVHFEYLSYHPDYISMCLVSFFRTSSIANWACRPERRRFIPIRERGERVKRKTIRRDSAYAGDQRAHLRAYAESRRRCAVSN